MRWTPIVTAEDVTPEILQLVYYIVDTSYSDQPTDELLMRLESFDLADGSCPDLGGHISSLAISKIIREAKRYRDGVS